MRLNTIHKIVGIAYCETETEREKVWSQIVEQVEKIRAEFISVGVFPDVELSIKVNGQRRSIVRILSNDK